MYLANINDKSHALNQPLRTALEAANIEVQADKMLLMSEQHEKLLTEQKQAQASLKREIESLQSHLSNADKEIRNQKHVVSHLKKKASYYQNNHIVVTNDADA